MAGRLRQTDMETEPTTSGESAPATSAEDSRRQSVLAEYRKVLLQHKEQDAKVRSSKPPPASSGATHLPARHRPLR